MLSGNLAEFPLPGLLGALMNAGRTGRLRIQAPFLEGEVYLQAGQPVHARAARGEGVLEGLEALELLAGLRRAPYVFEPEVLPPSPTLQGLLEASARLAEAQAQWEALSALPSDWDLVLRLRPGGETGELDPGTLGLLAGLEGKSLAEVLLVPHPLRRARILNTLLSLGVLEAVPRVEVSPVGLLVLPIYGPGSGVAYVDEALYKDWAQRLRHAFRLRLRFRGGEEVLEVRPRLGLEGRIGILEADLRRLRLRRGDRVEAVPEV